MARWSGTGRVMAYLLAGTAMAAGSGGLAMAEFPGEVWNVSYVKVGGASADIANSVNVGLLNASQRYFYGDKSTRIDATVRSGSVDLRMVDLATGQTVAEQRGLPFSANGNVSRSIENAALAWMDGLNCAQGCQVAVSGSAPKPVQVAEAPAPTPPKPEPQPEPQQVAVAPIPQPEPVKPQPTKPKAVAEPAKPVQKEPAKPKIQLALEQPKVAAPKPAKPAAQAKAKRPAASARSEGVDADQVLAALDKPKRSTPKPAAAATPQPSVSSNAPTLVRLPTPRAAVPEVAAPTTPAAPIETAAAASAAAAESSPEISLALPVPEVSTPITPPAAESSDAPELAAVTPQTDVETPSLPEVTTPEPAEVTVPVPAAPEVATPETPAAETPSVPATPSVPEAPEIAVKEPEPETTPEPAPEVEVAAAPPNEDPAPEVESVVAVQEEPVLKNPADNTGTDLDDEQLALADTNPPQVPALPSAARDPIETPDTQSAQGEGEPDKVETRIAAVDPAATGPTLANARWIGFTPAVFTGSDNRSGAWIAGPFDRKQRTGWITDTATGATTRVTFFWREASAGGRTATLSREAASALGIGQGDVANVAVYLPR